MVNKRLDQETIRCILFKEDNTWYGVALELHIVESGDDQEVVHFNLNRAIRGYGAVGKGAMRAVPDTEYEEMWNNLVSFSPKPTPYTVAYYGIANIAS